MVSEGMTITLIGLSSGMATAIVNLSLSKKIKGRVEIGTSEVAMAMAAVFIGSSIGYYFIKSRGEETEEIVMETEAPTPLLSPSSVSAPQKAIAII